MLQVFHYVQFLTALVQWCRGFFHFLYQLGENLVVLTAEPRTQVKVRARHRRMLRKAEGGRREAGSGRREILAHKINLEFPTIPTPAPISRFGLVYDALCGLTPQRVWATLIDERLRTICSQGQQLGESTGTVPVSVTDNFLLQLTPIRFWASSTMSRPLSI